jgi:hypothetical protein
VGLGGAKTQYSAAGFPEKFHAGRNRSTTTRALASLPIFVELGPALDKAGFIGKRARGFPKGSHGLAVSEGGSSSFPAWPLIEAFSDGVACDGYGRTH